MKPTQERIDELMREHGITLITEDAYKFAALAYEAGRKDENEACAKVAENRWLNKANCTAEEMYEMQKKNIAGAIRARREQ